LCSAVAARRGDLFKEKLLGEPQSDGFSPRESIAISDEIREYIDRELGISWTAPEKDHRAGLLTYENITEKSLFYNSEERISIDRLSEMLKQENFINIQQRMSECGMRSGFACLFYGAPGTGKTETVLQLARATGRDIMQVNVASIKSKYVGDSEKNIRNIFGRYRACCEKCAVKPILLFNEADAIINKRSSNAERSVDKRENAVQNIILEEIEKLDGILIATTNLASNMDSAFERRFIYKVEFHKPDVGTKKLIWQSMINGLDDDDAMVLAKEFDLSGGQIENVTRKQLVDKVLYNELPTLEKLRGYCTQEGMGMRGGNRPRVGF
jgi:SpoVK/Ycf46/Vps4 family AAA+-type ATPase